MNDWLDRWHGAPFVLRLGPVVLWVVAAAGIRASRPKSVVPCLLMLTTVLWLSLGSWTCTGPS